MAAQCSSICKSTRYELSWKLKVTASLFKWPALFMLILGRDYYEHIALQNSNLLSIFHCVVVMWKHYNANKIYRYPTIQRTATPHSLNVFTFYMLVLTLDKVNVVLVPRTQYIPSQWMNITCWVPPPFANAFMSGVIVYTYVIILYTAEDCICIHSECECYV